MSMWWLVPAAITLAAFLAAHRMLRGVGNADFGAVKVITAMISLGYYGAATLVSLLAWAAYLLFAFLTA